jgi:serine/threonine-protein kinase RsbW
VSANERRTAVTGDAAQLPILNRFLQEFWLAANLPPAQAPSFELALEEIFMNIVMHGSQPGRTATVEVSLALVENGLTMTVEDNGPQFDPLTLPPPDLTTSLAERPVGGLGVFLVRQVMDAVSYQRVGSLNRLTVTKSLAG